MKSQVRILSPRFGERRWESNMAKKDASTNGHDRLEEAMIMLIQNQSGFLGRLAEIDRNTSQRLTELERANSERFARIESEIAAIFRVLAEHSRLLERLPEAVRENIGFKGQL